MSISPQTFSSTVGGASIWLLPSVADTVLLRGIIAELAGRFGTPLFEPHLTLAGDLQANWSGYLPLLDELAQACPVVSQEIETVVLTDAYFRSFYASFGRSPELETLKCVCVSAVGGSLDDFTPHVSLLYGQVAEPAKSEAAATVRQRLAARRVVFDRVVVTNSSDNVPINEWRVHAGRNLATGGAAR